jgi:hypothetical protein
VNLFEQAFSAPMELDDSLRVQSVGRTGDAGHADVCGDDSGSLLHMCMKATAEKPLPALVISYTD